METLRLTNGAKVAVIGGGPAGAFFGLHLRRESRALGLSLEVTIFERRRDFSAVGGHSGHLHGCNYCAGGISPRLNDRLRDMGLSLPREIIKNDIKTITVQSFWKNIEVAVPAQRPMYAVYRGSLPANRPDGANSLDGFLLEQALQEGCLLSEAEAVAMDYSPAGMPVVTLLSRHGNKTVEADFVAFAGGVNLPPGGSLNASPWVQNLKRLLPAFVPPRLRHALIFELDLGEGYADDLQGEIFFVEYGSKALSLDMCSLLPKGRSVTVVLVGPAIDRLTDHAKIAGVIREFLRLSHIQKLLPRQAKLANVCACNPNLVVGAARHPFGNRIALIGDMAAARLYKDGILSACQTAQALAHTILHRGVDTASLQAGYGPTVANIRSDNRYGQLVFRLHNMIFRSPILSRIIYQAIILERKTQFKHHRQLEDILWNIASGDDLYKNIFLSMIHPSTSWMILTMGGVVTLRNYFTELVFGLPWRGFGRFTTGVSKEGFELKRAAYLKLLESHNLPRPRRREFERIYSIKIRASRRAIEAEIGRFGEKDRQYFTPRWVQVNRIGGHPNEPGCVIQYRVVVPQLNFSLRLEKNLGGHFIIYRVLDGFGRDGVMIFEIEETPKRTCLLTIYVVFDFHRGRHWLTRPLWWGLKWLFPAYIHDVIWNHSLCQLKDNVEKTAEAGLPVNWELGL